MPRFDEQLGKFLKKQRGEQTLEAFGRRIGLKKSSVYKLENALVSARLCTIEQICKRLRCELTDIFPPK